MVSVACPAKASVKDFVLGTDARLMLWYKNCSYSNDKIMLPVSGFSSTLGFSSKSVFSSESSALFRGQQIFLSSLLQTLAFNRDKILDAAVGSELWILGKNEKIFCWCVKSVIGGSFPFGICQDYLFRSASRSLAWEQSDVGMQGLFSQGQQKPRLFLLHTWLRGCSMHPFLFVH